VTGTGNDRSGINVEISWHHTITNNRVVVPIGYPAGRAIVNMSDSGGDVSWQVPGIFSGNCYQVA
jgi:hypothetical protein